MTQSDRLFIAPTGEIAKRLEKIRTLLRAIIDLWVDDICPAWDIAVRWRFNLGPSIGANSVSVRFRIDGHLVYEQSGISITQELEGTGDQLTTIKITDVGLANQIYKFGRRRIDIEVIADGAGVYRTRRHFRVVREWVDASWWTWDPGSGEVAWKDPYVLRADFTNKALASLAVVWAELSEIENVRFVETVNPCDYEAIKTEERTNVASGAVAPYTFPLVQDWKWIRSGAYIADGPLAKTFTYAVSFKFTDEFGNNYGYTCSEHVHRRVAVSQAKRDAGQTATVAAANAAAFAVAAGIAAASIIGAVTGVAEGFFVAAGVAYGIAAAAGEIAKDPPFPDPNFRQPVIVQPLTLPAWPSEPSPVRMEAMRKLFEAAAQILALENARSVTRSRMLGARLFGDSSALELQRTGYSRIDREMQEAAARLDRILPDVQAEVEANAHLDPEKLAAEFDRLARCGLPREIYDGVLKAGLQPELARDFCAMSADDTLIELSKANGLFLIPLVGSLKRFVRAIQDEREAVLAGEDACVRPPDQEEDEEEFPQAGEEPRPGPRPRRRCCCESL